MFLSKPKKAGIGIYLKWLFRQVVVGEIHFGLFYCAASQTAALNQMPPR